MNRTKTANVRADTVTTALQTHYEDRALRRVRAIVEDAGGKWTRDARRLARCKVRSVLRDEDPVRHVLQYHATDAAERWATNEPGDVALRHAVQRAARAVGVRIPTMATLGALSLLVEMAGLPGLISPEVAENIKARMGA
jgi:hypothetical protein